MSVIIGVAICIFGLLDLLSLVTEIFVRSTAGSNEAKVSSVAHRRRILLHLGMWVLIIGGVWDIALHDRRVLWNRHQELVWAR